MRTLHSKRIFWGLTLMLLLALLPVLLLAGSGLAAAAPFPGVGIVCTDGPNFDLTAWRHLDAKGV